MSNKRFEMYEIRRVLVQMRLGAADREIAQSGLLGRENLSRIRKLADAKGLLDRGKVLAGRHRSGGGVWSALEPAGQWSRASSPGQT